MSILQEENSRKFKNFKAKQEETRKKRITKLGSVTHHSTPKKSHLIVSRQQTDHSSQLSFQLKNLTVQVANLREDCILFLPILQHHMIVLYSPHLGLVILDTTLQIQPAMLQLRLLQQGLIALLVRILPPPPVINQNKISNL
jgi:hypothetical protein